jgi:hypothetical protein
MTETENRCQCGNVLPHGATMCDECLTEMMMENRREAYEEYAWRMNLNGDNE